MLSVFLTQCRPDAAISTQMHLPKFNPFKMELKNKSMCRNKKKKIYIFKEKGFMNNKQLGYIVFNIY